MSPSQPAAAESPGIVVLPATVERFADIEPVINRTCWCQWWRRTAAEYGRGSAATIDQLAGERRQALLEQCAVGPAPGLVAYARGEPVGWCGLGPRREMHRIERSRTIPRVDDRPAWSIVCFSVRPGRRRQGIATALLAAAIAYARSQGAELLEAYPTDAAGSRRSAAGSYTGFTSMFEVAGFRRVVQTASRADGLPRWLMRLELGSS